MKKNSDPTMKADTTTARSARRSPDAAARISAARDDDDHVFPGQLRAERDEAGPKDGDEIVEKTRAGVETRMKGTIGYNEGGGGFGSFDAKHTGLNRSLHSRP